MKEENYICYIWYEILKSTHICSFMYTAKYSTKQDNFSYLPE